MCSNLARKATTVSLPIGGAKDYPAGEERRRKWIDETSADSGLSRERVTALLDRYGSLAREYIASLGSSAEKALETLPHYSRSEIEHLASTEQVEHLTDLICRKPELAALTAECDVVFMAKKGPESLAWVPQLLEAGLKVIDHGGEFRFRSAATYEAFYGNEHTCAGILEEAVYGLPERYRDAIASARIVGNPGCYPTCAVLPMIPLLASGIVSADTPIMVDSYSGVSGAGKRYSAGSRNLFVDCDSNVRAYGPITHRHAPEIEQEMTAAAGLPVSAVFVPHLIPVDRGILTTQFARLTAPTTVDDVLALWHAAYDSEPFLRIFDNVGDVELSNVARTNYCDFACAIDGRTNTLVVVSALDNVIKGACGLAVQNMNLMFGLPETTGLLHRCV